VSPGDRRIAPGGPLLAGSPPDPEWVAGQVAVRAADPQTVANAAAAVDRESQHAGLLTWRPASLAQGHAGLAVLCAALDAAHPGAGWDQAGHHHLAAAAARVSPHDGSLFSGLAGVGFAATLLAAGRPRYERLLGQVDKALEPLLEGALSRLAMASGCRVSEFDLVSGLTGTGVYLLTRLQVGNGRLAAPAGGGGSPAPGQIRGPVDCEAMLKRVLGGLIQLTAGSGHPRRWHTPAELASGPLRREFPRGLHNCGLAHGVPGPLALLSLAMLSGVQVPGARDAIRSSASWLIRHQTGTEQEPDWPDGVALDAAELPSSEPGHVPGRSAWCYGAPGVARSLWLAGLAVGEPGWRDLAARTIRAVAARPSPAWGLATPGFCHGAAGLLRVLQRFAADLDDPAVASASGRLAAELAAEFDPESLLGVRSVDPDGVPVDQPGLLDGAAGVALALLGLPETGPVPTMTAVPAWDRMFLLA
jgi:class I lanthipeptide synthase